jgi:hypothetical protein
LLPLVSHAKVVLCSALLVCELGWAGGCYNENITSYIQVLRDNIIPPFQYLDNAAWEYDVLLQPFHCRLCYTLNFLISSIPTLVCLSLSSNPFSCTSRHLCFFFSATFHILHLCFSLITEPYANLFGLADLSTQL